MAPGSAARTRSTVQGRDGSRSMVQGRDGSRSMVQGRDGSRSMVQARDGSRSMVQVAMGQARDGSRSRFRISFQDAFKVKARSTAVGLERITRLIRENYQTSWSTKGCWDANMLCKSGRWCRVASTK